MTHGDWVRTLDSLEQALDAYERALADPGALDPTTAGELNSFRPDAALPPCPAELERRLIALEARNRDLIVRTEAAAEAVRPSPHRRTVARRSSAAAFDQLG